MTETAAYGSFAGKMIPGDFMRAASTYRDLIGAILKRRQSCTALVIGINGMAGSGKSTLAKELAGLLEQGDIPTCRVSVDDFHHPKKRRYRLGVASPEGYYHHSINYAAFGEGALRPAFEASQFPVRCQTKHFDLERDEEDRRFEMLPERGVLLSEGVFLFRPELANLMHMRIYVHADVEIIMKRVLKRDMSVLGSAEAITARYGDKYLPGEKLYHDEVSPQKLAHILLDNTDPANPVLAYKS
jgi:uridine kinase